MRGTLAVLSIVSLTLGVIGLVPGCRSPAAALDSGLANTDAGASDAGSADAGNPDAGSMNPYEKVAHACALLVSCDDPIFGNERGSQCIQTAFVRQFFGVNSGPARSELRTFFDCLSTANSCNDIASCRSRDHGSAYCAQSPGSSCDGDILVDCSRTPVTSTDCTALGLTCRSNGGVVTCADGTTCSPGEAGCLGNKLFVCAGPVGRVAFDCSEMAAGTSCQLVDAGQPVCAPAGVACPGIPAPRCDGNTFVLCDASFARETRVECNSLFPESACAASSPSGVVGSYCYPADPQDNECWYDSKDRCDGATLLLCQNGRFQGVDCTRLGFGTCQVLDLGTADQQKGFGRCVP